MSSILAHFLLVVEVLTQHLQNSKHIESIKIENVEDKVTQFADDTTWTLRNEYICFFIF